LSQNQSRSKGGRRVAGSRKAAGTSKKGGLTGLIVIAAVLGVVILAAVCCGVYYLYIYDEIYPGVSVEGVSCSGMTREELLTDLNKRFGTASPSAGSFEVTVMDKKYTIDFTAAMAYYDLDKTAEEAYLVGREGGIMKRISDISAASKTPVEHSIAVKINEGILEPQINEIIESCRIEKIDYRYEWDGTTLLYCMGRDGLEVNREKLTAVVDDKFARGDLENISFEPDVIKAERPGLDEINRAIYVEMKDPYFDLEKDPTFGTVVEGITGIALNIPESEAILKEVTEGAVELPLILTYPELSAEDYKNMIFRDILGETTTPFNPGLVGRTTNVLLAAEFCNGVVLLPGEEFSYNGTVGERTAERGFKYGSVYTGGTVEDGIGGGICQTSSTIYSACLKADLEILERRNHSYTVAYVPLGEDAAVSWGTLDYKFKNNTEYPIRLDMTWTGNTLTCTIMGTQTVEGKEIKMVHKVLSTTPAGERFEVDETLEKGTKKVKNNAFDGKVVESYRVTIINGEETERVYESKSTYKKLDKLTLYHPWVEGGGPDDPPPAETDPTGTPVPTEPGTSTTTPEA